MGTLIRTIVAACVLNTLSLSASADSGRELQDADHPVAAAGFDACQLEPAASAAWRSCSSAALAAASWFTLSPIDPAWQIDLQAVPAEPEQRGRMSYVVDVYRMTRDFGRRLLLEPVRLLKPSRQQAGGHLPVGIELDGGWSVGLGYDSGLTDSPGPVYSIVSQGGRYEPSAMLLTHRRF